MYMKKHLKGIRIGSLLALCACLLLAWYFPSLLQSPQEEHLPHAQRQLLTVWIRGDTISASGWVKEMAAAYQKAHDGVNVWVRTVTAADLELLAADFSHAAPDLLFFMAGEEISPNWLAGEPAPLCMAGYALVGQSQTAATIAPTSLFGVTPAPEKEALATPVPKEAWPQSLAADDQLGAKLLEEIGAPAGAKLLPAAQVQAAFLQNEVQAALLSTVQIRALSAQGKGMELLCAAPGSDLVLFGAVMREACAPAGDFLKYLLGAESQQKLSARGLFSPRGAALYGSGTPILQAVEAALHGGWLPDPITWPQEKWESIQLGQLLYAAN